ncbi:uncharacterized protein Nmag_1300 [Natrialba magadii ATCC 43099]|uniref:Uncharacterized protein n=1 Tax=Natrialba magadii (strain ATCC 43099 / DSM 3394 / CCM 3739 / CIP 104546 / IAM 13178 / JCM 8861 / NBRC 102185 / NCIMB 2190 / MS3) TaxID=547559 RepID=D3SST4_NATMM|nr:hypothetical protein [Natrialba magadii]ADD04880.1 uncharacterized protein Nmag_1300 [Natrialba magadii ATCC 43099]ELY24465.1 hypothetical protein C500_19020 [Natrialba magadii ATCC 43099]
MITYEKNETLIPRLSGYGKLTVGSVVAGVVVLLLGNSSSLADGVVSLAVVVLVVAMYRNRSDGDNR